MDNHALLCVVEFMEDMLSSVSTACRVFRSSTQEQIVAFVKFPFKESCRRGEWNGSLKCPIFQVKTEFCIERWETTDIETLVVEVMYFVFFLIQGWILSGWWSRAWFFPSLRVW